MKMPWLIAGACVYTTLPHRCGIYNFIVNVSMRYPYGKKC